jgi:hypothetical protein
MARLLTYTIEQGRSICDSLGFVTVSLGGEYFQAPSIMATVTASVLPVSGIAASMGGPGNTTPSAGGAFMQSAHQSNAHLVSFNNSTNQAIFGGGVSGSIINYTAFGLRKRG